MYTQRGRRIQNSWEDQGDFSVWGIVILVFHTPPFRVSQGTHARKRGIHSYLISLACRDSGGIHMGPSWSIHAGGLVHVFSILTMTDL